MSPPPVRFDVNASRLPSGAYNGRDSLAGCDTSSRASPPCDDAAQMSPPDTNAISLRSGEMAGSVKYGRGVRTLAVCAETVASVATRTRMVRIGGV